MFRLVILCAFLTQMIYARSISLRDILDNKDLLATEIFSKSKKAIPENAFEEKVDTPAASTMTDNFILKLTSALAKRIQEKLKEKHDLSTTEVKLLEFFIRQMIQSNKAKQFQVSEKAVLQNTESMFHKKDSLEQNLIDFSKHKEDSERKDILKKEVINLLGKKRPANHDQQFKERLDKALNSILSVLAAGNHTKNYNKNEVVIDNKRDGKVESTLKSATENQQQQNKELIDLKKDDINIQRKSSFKTDSKTAKRIIAANDNGDDENNNNSNKANQEIEKELRSLIDLSVNHKKETKETKLKNNDESNNNKKNNAPILSTHDILTNELLKLVTKTRTENDHKNIDDGSNNSKKVEGIFNKELLDLLTRKLSAKKVQQENTNTKRVITNNADAEFANELWNKLGVKPSKRSSAVANSKESNRNEKRISHCENLPKLQCSEVCFTKCKNVCFEVVERVCSNL